MTEAIYFFIVWGVGMVMGYAAYELNQAKHGIAPKAGRKF